MRKDRCESCRTWMLTNTKNEIIEMRNYQETWAWTPNEWNEWKEAETKWNEMEWHGMPSNDMYLGWGAYIVRAWRNRLSPDKIRKLSKSLPYKLVSDVFIWIEWFLIILWQMTNWSVSLSSVVIGSRLISRERVNSVRNIFMITINMYTTMAIQWTEPYPWIWPILTINNSSIFDLCFSSQCRNVWPWLAHRIQL